MISLQVATLISNKTVAAEVAAVLAETPCRVVLELSEVPVLDLMLAQFASLTPQVLLLDMELKIAIPASALIRQLRAEYPALTIVALAKIAEPGLILDAMRAGANEFLFLPFGEQLLKVLESASGEWQKLEASRGKQGKVVGVLSAKGGCGASTVACHLAADLPRQTKGRALLLDLDLQTALLSFLVKAKSPYTVLDAATNVHRMDANYWKRLVSNGIPGVEILSAPAPLTSQAPLRRDELNHLMRFARSQYEWVVADLGRSLTPVSLSAIESVNELLVVTTPEVPALHLAKHILRKLKDGGMSTEAVRVLVNRMPKSPDLTLDDLETILERKIHAIMPDDYSALNAVYSEGKLLEPDTQLGRSIGSLTRKVAGIQRPQQQSKKFKIFGGK